MKKMIESDQEEIKDQKKEQKTSEQISKDRGSGASLSQILADAAQNRKRTNFRVSEEIKRKEKEEKILAQFYKDIAFGASLPQILEDAAKKEDSTPVLVYVEYIPKLESLVQHVSAQNKLLQKRYDDGHEIISKKRHTDSVDLDFDLDTDDDEVNNNWDVEFEEIKRHPKRKLRKLSDYNHDHKILKNGKSGRKSSRDPAVQEKLDEIVDVCGHSYWKSSKNFADWRKKPMWQHEFDLFYDTLTDNQKSNINDLIELSYDPVHYLLTLKKGYYTHNEVVSNMSRGSPNLKKLLVNMKKYLASYASKISSE